MVDISKTIAPKSDQTNADDLISGSITITITKVSATESSADQPVAISYVGDNNKPYKPCKSMRRVMVHCWGADGSRYVGRSMTLYNDPAVTFGGSKVGGIRISHMSHIDKPVTMALTATRAQRKPYTVQPLMIDVSPPFDDSRIRSVIVNLKEAAEAGNEIFGLALQSALDNADDDEKKVLRSEYKAMKAIADTAGQKTAES